MNICDAIVSDFRMEAQSTRRVLEAVPEDKLQWKPHDKSMSLGQLAGHIAETPAWIPTMLEDELDFGNVSQDWQPFVATSRAGLLEAFEKNAGDFEKVLAGKSDDFMRATWTMRSGEKVLMQAPRHEAIRGTLIHHTIHHRGQLTVYLRLLGVPVPGTYGPTADVEAFA